MIEIDHTGAIYISARRLDANGARALAAALHIAAGASERVKEGPALARQVSQALGGIDARWDPESQQVLVGDNRFTIRGAKDFLAGRTR